MDVIASAVVIAPVAPLSEFGRMGDGAVLVAAVVLGVAFGWFLERAGMGSARKLAAQFYLTDLTVFKVMFSAIVTAMLGVWVLSRAGALDLGRVYVPPTYLLPQLAGGLVFGAGFAVAGLCPGTSCVAASTGRLDGLAVVGGMLGGVFVFAELFPALASFYESTPRGTLTLPPLLGAPYGVVVFAVVTLALAGFAGAEWVERRAARRSGGREPSPPAPGPSRLNRPLAIGAAALALVALVTAGAWIPWRSAAVRVDVEELAREVEREEDHVTALELAEWIRVGKPGLRVVDVRSDSEYTAYHIPGAERLSLGNLVHTTLGAAETVVLYSEGGAHAAQGWFLLRARGVRRVYFLRGGLYEWLEQVIEPTLPAQPTAAERAAYDRAKALSRYFGGLPSIGLDRTGDAGADISAPAGSPGAAPLSPAGRSVIRINRRGC